MNSLVSSTVTPWAAYDAGFYAAQAADVTAVSNAAKTNAIAQATAQKTAEVTQIDAETAWRNAYATASSVLSTGIASANLGFATVQSLIYSSMGGSNLQLPTVSRPTDLAGKYKVPVPGNTYRASISSVSSTNYYYGWWGGYWWGAWGYFGSGYWYSGYGGYGGYGGDGGYLYGSQVSSAAGVSLTEPQMQFPDSFWQIDSDQIADQMQDGTIEVRYGDAKVLELVIPQQAIFARVGGVAEDDGDGDAGGVGSRAGDSGFGGADGGSISLPTVNAKVSDGFASSNHEVMKILSGISQELGDLWTLAGSVTQTVINRRPSAFLADLASELTGSELHSSSSSYSSSSESSLGPADRTAAQSGVSLTVTRDDSSVTAALAAGTEIVTRDEKLDAREKELLDKFNKLFQSGVNGQNVDDFFVGVKDGFVDGVKNGLGGMLVDGVYYVFTDGVGDAIDAGVYVAKTGVSAVYHGLQLHPAVRYVGTWWKGYDIGANEEQAVREFTGKAAVTAVRAAVWTKQNLDYAAEVLTQVQAQINEGGQVLLEALMTGDTEKLDAVLDSLDSKGSLISREAMHLVRLAMVEIGHAIVEMEPKQAGYIVGTVAYEAVETAVLVAIEAGLAAATVGTAGGATPATAGGTAAIVAAKAAAFSKLVNRLSERADLLDFPKIAKAIDRLNEMVVWMIKYPMCFVAGTKVHTLSGLKNIEDIQRDDWVLTRDEHNPTSENRYRRVTELFQTSPSRLLTIAYRNDVTGVQESLTCTGEHPFFVSGREELSRETGSGRPHLDDESALLTQPKVTVTELRRGSFIPADGLAIGDTLVLADGNEATITSIEEQSAAEGEAFTTFNFAVDGDHTYFVGESGVWVHNTGNVCDEAFDLFAKRVANGDKESDALREAIRHIRKSEDNNPLAQKHIDDLLNKLEKDASPVPGLKNGKLAGKLHPKTGVPFDTKGFPIFESAGNIELPSHKLGKSVSDHAQFKESSKRLWELIKNDDVKRSAFTADQLKAIERGDSKISGYTWHHHQDGKTMQLVDEVDHALTGHSGGRQLTGGRS